MSAAHSGDVGTMASYSILIDGVSIVLIIVCSRSRGSFYPDATLVSRSTFWFTLSKLAGSRSDENGRAYCRQVEGISSVFLPLL